MTLRKLALAFIMVTATQASQVNFPSIEDLETANQIGACSILIELQSKYKSTIENPSNSLQLRNGFNSCIDFFNSNQDKLVESEKTLALKIVNQIKTVAIQKISELEEKEDAEKKAIVQTLIPSIQKAITAYTDAINICYNDTNPLINLLQQLNDFKLPETLNTDYQTKAFNPCIKEKNALIAKIEERLKQIVHVNPPQNGSTQAPMLELFVPFCDMKAIQDQEDYERYTLAKQREQEWQSIVYELNRLASIKAEKERVIAKDRERLFLESQKRNRHLADESNSTYTSSYKKKPVFIPAPKPMLKRY